MVLRSVNSNKISDILTVFAEWLQVLIRKRVGQTLNCRGLTSMWPDPHLGSHSFCCSQRAPSWNKFPASSSQQNTGSCTIQCLCLLHKNRLTACVYKTQSVLDLESNPKISPVDVFQKKSALCVGTQFPYCLNPIEPAFPGRGHNGSSTWRCCLLSCLGPANNISIFSTRSWKEPVVLHPAHSLYLLLA